MKRNEKIWLIMVVVMFILIKFISGGIKNLISEMELIKIENIELKQELDELEKENYKLNFEKSLERTCGLSTVECKP